MEEKSWRPHPRQERFFELPDSVFEALYGGAAGGGKSEALLMLPIVRGFYKIPKFKGIIFRRTFSELESEIIIRSHDFYAPTGGVYNAEKHRWTWPSGAIMQFGHCEHEQDIRKYDTAEYNYAAFDELTSFTEFQYVYFTLTRVRTSRPGLPTIVRSGTNPGNIGHAWVRKRFIECGPANTLYRDTVSGIRKIFIPSKAEDNPHIDAGYVRRLQGLPESERKAKSEGDWYTFEGQVFNDYRPTWVPGTPANHVHVVDDFAIPAWWPRVLAVDWGFAAMTYALWGAVSPEGRIYLYREYSRTGAKITEWAADIKNATYEPLAATVLCRSAWQNRGEEDLIASQFQRITNFRPEKPENRRILGKLTIQEVLRLEPAPSTKIIPDTYNFAQATQILRNQGLDAYQQYQNQYTPATESYPLPRLQIFRSLTLLLYTIPLCVYGKDTRSEKPSEDVAEFNGDDPYDTLRYLILRIVTIKPPLERDKEIQTVANAYASLASTGDQTAFYRRMELLDQGTAQAVSRFSHGSPFEPRLSPFNRFAKRPN